METRAAIGILSRKIKIRGVDRRFGGRVIFGRIGQLSATGALRGVEFTTCGIAHPHFDYFGQSSKFFNDTMQQNSTNAPNYTSSHIPSRAFEIFNQSRTSAITFETITVLSKVVKCSFHALANEAIVLKNSRYGFSTSFHAQQQYTFVFVSFRHQQLTDNVFYDFFGGAGMDLSAESTFNVLERNLVTQFREIASYVSEDPWHVCAIRVLSQGNRIR